MKTSKKRKYRGCDFGVGLGTNVPSTAFHEIEAIAMTLGTTKSGVARLLLLRGLAEYHRDGKLTTTAGMPFSEVASHTTASQTDSSEVLR